MHGERFAYLLPATMAYNNQDQQSRNRLHLNFEMLNHQKSLTVEQVRAYRTTSSAFLQPFPQANGQQVHAVQVRYHQT